MGRFATNLRLRRGTGLLTALFALALPLSANGQRTGTIYARDFSLMEASELGFEIEARAVGTSWERQGAEAAVLIVYLDGMRNQDLLLWSGDSFFTYRILLGRASAGRHTVSLSLDAASRAKNARAVEIRSARPLLFNRANTSEEDLIAIANAPIIGARSDSIERFTDIPLLMYYELTRGPEDLLRLRYTLIFSNEDGGTQTAALMARWGRTTDIEWVYELSLRGGRIEEASYQGVEHRTKPFAGRKIQGDHPLLTVVSSNNNFSDLPSPTRRFAPLPIRVELKSASRESVMDAHPWIYRLMAEELKREGRIGESPSDLDKIADPRDYLYIEARAEAKSGPIAFEVQMDGARRAFRSDGCDERLCVEREGYFRAAVRLPKDYDPRRITSLRIRCCGCRENLSCSPERVKVLRAFKLDRDYIPHQLEVDRWLR
ncbi:MAG: hypothetical protein IRZ19_03115 [Pyrinomonas methylaliphatogenes]|nr:hypothetical protein [Pyrinomonas methylaliphatogenes]